MTNYEIVKAWRKRNPDKVNAQARRYRKKHPDKIKAIKDRHRANNLERIRKREAVQARVRRADKPAQALRMARFKARKEAERILLAGRPRADVCDVCEESGKTVFDHSHSSGEFRGWICNRCNKVLGLVYDDKAVLLALVHYLERENGRLDNEATQENAEEGICYSGKGT